MYNRYFTLNRDISINEQYEYCLTIFTEARKTGIVPGRDCQVDLGISDPGL